MRAQSERCHTSPMRVDQDSAPSHLFVAFPPIRGTGLTVKRVNNYQFVYIAVAVAAVAAFVLYNVMSTSFHFKPRIGLALGLVYGVLAAAMLAVTAFVLFRRRRITICVTGG